MTVAVMPRFFQKSVDKSGYNTRRPLRPSNTDLYLAVIYRFSPNTEMGLRFFAMMETAG
jgi:hypothetical protein